MFLFKDLDTCLRSKRHFVLFKDFSLTSRGSNFLLFRSKQRILGKIIPYNFFKSGKYTYSLPKFGYTMRYERVHGNGQL